MKSCDQALNEIYEKGEKLKKKRAERRKRIRGALLTLSPICLVLVVALSISVWHIESSPTIDPGITGISHPDDGRDTEPGTVTDAFETTTVVENTTYSTDPSKSVFNSYEEFIRYANGDPSFSSSAPGGPGLVDGVFVDIAELLSLPELREDHVETVYIKDDGYSFQRNVFWVEKSWLRTPVYYVGVTYDPNGFASEAEQRWPTFKKVEDFNAVANVKSGVSILYYDDCVVMIEKAQGAYLCINLVFGKYRIGLSFGGCFRTLDEIKSGCGDYVASLFSCNNEIAGKTVSELKEKVWK